MIFHPNKALPGCMMPDGGDCCAGHAAVVDDWHKQRREIERLRAALVEIRDHWANQYDHPRKESEMYRGPYGIGVTDGHRACTIIAERALAHPSADRGASDA